MKATVAVVGLVGMLAGLDAGAAERDACTRIRISSAPVSERAPFSASRVLDLRFDALIEKRLLHHDRVMEVRLLGPNGHLYRTSQVPVAAHTGRGREAESRSVELPGYPLLIEQVPPVEVDGEDATGKAPDQQLVQVRVANLPVAGADIVTSSLYGTWRVEARFAGRREKCEARFVVTR